MAATEHRMTVAERDLMDVRLRCPGLEAALQAFITRMPGEQYSGIALRLGSNPDRLGDVHRDGDSPGATQGPSRSRPEDSGPAAA